MYYVPRTLIISAGLINGQVAKAMGNRVSGFFMDKLTWEGHEFLDAIRSDTVWKKTKRRFADEGLTMSIDLVRSTAKKISMAIIDAA